MIKFNAKDAEGRGVRFSNYPPHPSASFALKKIPQIFILLVCLAALLHPSPAQAADDDHTYVRLLKDDAGTPTAMQTAIVRFVSDGSAAAQHPDLIVELVAAVHVGEAAYYSELNKHFMQYDALLYELIAEPGTKVSERAADAPLNPLSLLQHAIKTALGLDFQLEKVDYAAANFVHADLSPDDFAASMEKHGESFLSILLELFLAGYRQSSAEPEKAQEAQLRLLLSLVSAKRQTLLKRSVAQQLAGMEEMFTSIVDRGGKTLIAERNLRALDVLSKEVKAGKRTIGIYYGAGHLPHMEENLKKQFGLKRENTTWLTAWELK